MTHHGYGKAFGNPAKFVQYVASLGVPFPEFFGFAAIIAEFLGGIFIVLGFLYRPATLTVFLTMLVAAFGAHGKDIFGDGELALLYAVVTLAMIFLGAGRYSADYLIISRWKKTS